MTRRSDRSERIRFVSSVDVAQLAGVSQSAVSRTFTPGASVSPLTREKVLAAAATLDYKPSRIPRIMLTGRSRLVGVVVGGLDNPYYAGVLDRFTLALRANGQQVVLVRAETALALDGVLQEIASYRADAVLTAIPVRTEAAAAALSALRVPVVCFNADMTAERVMSVRSANEEAGRMAASLLRARGARRFCFIGAPPIHAASLARRNGFRAALLENGEAAPLEIAGGDSYEGAFAAARDLFSRGDRPDGLFCSNDLMGCGAIDALRLCHGIEVPRDALVIGYDNIPQAAWGAYELSSFDQQADQMIAAAFDLLTAAMDDPAGSPTHQIRTISARLVERRSTTPA